VLSKGDRGVRTGGDRRVKEEGGDKEVKKDSTKR